MSSAVVLLSGGLDSAVAAALCGADGFALHALTVDYGQRHCREIEAAVSIARHLDCREHLIQRLDLTAWGGSSLTDDIPVPAAGVQSGIPVTYVPARNTVLLALATAFAEARGADRIVIGANQVDYSGYPDCRGEFLQAFEAAIALGTKCGVEGRPIQIYAPLLDLTKVEIVKLGQQLGVPIDLTWSCYAGTPNPCGVCDACRIRAAGIGSR